MDQLELQKLKELLHGCDPHRINDSVEYIGRPADCHCIVCGMPYDDLPAGSNYRYSDGNDTVFRKLQI